MSQGILSQKICIKDSIYLQQQIETFETSSKDEVLSFDSVLIKTNKPNRIWNQITLIQQNVNHKLTN